MEFECRLGIIFAEIKHEDKSFTQRKFAKKVGVSTATISALVNEKQTPTFEVAYRIAKELNRYMEEIWILIKDDKPNKEEYLSQHIEMLDFEPRIFLLLKRNQIHTYADLLNQDLNHVRGAGPKAKEILDAKVKEMLEILKSNYEP